MAIEKPAIERGGGFVVTPPPLTITLFPSWYVDISFKDDVAVILLLSISFALLIQIGLFGVNNRNRNSLAWFVIQGCRTGPPGHIGWQQVVTTTLCRCQLYPPVRDYEFGSCCCLGRWRNGWANRTWMETGCWATQNSSSALPATFSSTSSSFVSLHSSQPVFVNVYGAQESIPGLFKRFTNTGSVHNQLQIREHSINLSAYEVYVCYNAFTFATLCMEI